MYPIDPWLNVRRAIESLQQPQLAVQAAVLRSLDPAAAYQQAFALTVDPTVMLRAYKSAVDPTAAIRASIAKAGKDPSAVFREALARAIDPTTALRASVAKAVDPTAAFRASLSRVADPTAAFRESIARTTDPSTGIHTSLFLALESARSVIWPDAAEISDVGGLAESLDEDSEGASLGAAITEIVQQLGADLAAWWAEDKLARRVVSGFVCAALAAESTKLYFEDPWVGTLLVVIGIVQLWWPIWKAASDDQDK